MAVKAVIFDASDVLYNRSGVDERMFEFISKLSEKFKIGMITNLYASGIQAYFNDSQRVLFDYIHTYQKEGLSKPDPKVFEHTAEELGVLAANCVYVDDQIGNLQGAEDAGMKTILFETFEDFSSQLQQILGQQE